MHRHLQTTIPLSHALFISYIWAYIAHHMAVKHNSFNSYVDTGLAAYIHVSNVIPQLWKIVDY